MKCINNNNYYYIVYWLSCQVQAEEEMSSTVTGHLAISTGVQTVVHVFLLEIMIMSARVSMYVNAIILRKCCAFTAFHSN